MNNSAMTCGIVLLTAMVSGIGDGQQYVHEYLAGRGSGFMPAYWGSEYEKVIDQAKLFDSIYWDPTYLACEEVYGPGRIVESMTPSENENDYAEIQAKLDNYRYTKPWMMPEFMCNSVAPTAWYVMMTELGLKTWIAHDEYHNHLWVMVKVSIEPERWVAVEPSASMGSTLGVVVKPRCERDAYYSACRLYNTSSEEWAMGQKMDERYVSTRSYPDIPVARK